MRYIWIRSDVEFVLSFFAECSIVDISDAGIFTYIIY